VKKCNCWAGILGAVRMTTKLLMAGARWQETTPRYTKFAAQHKGETTMFEKASRLKLRFPTAVGSLTVEDLWDLPLTSNRTVSLDDIARALHQELKNSEETSFVVKTSNLNERLQLEFDVVKHIIDVKLAEEEAARTRAANREKKQRLQALIAEKQDESLKASSVEELQSMVEALD
jgi:hypothetical protein